MLYTMKQAYTATGMTYEALKFYCNEGLVPNVKRDEKNHRVFDEKDIEWIKSLTCLKNCGMSIEDMKIYLALCLQGPSTIPQRKTMLARQKKLLQARIKELKEYAAFIDWKQNLYDDIMAGKVEYVSNLIRTNEEDTAVH